jgi:heptose I phosphotransferase
MNQITQQPVAVSVPSPGGGSLWRRLLRGCRRIHERTDWKRFAGADWPESIMSVAVTDQFHAKQGRSTGRLIVEEHGERLAVYLKRHYRLPWWQGWLAALWPKKGWSPAMQEWRHLGWARQQGLPVPARVAVAEYIGPWGKLQSFLAIEELTGMVPLHEAIPAAARLLDSVAFRRWKSSLIAELVRLTHELHRRRYFHKDFYLCHFFIPRADLDRLGDWQGRVHLIDLHRLARHRWTWPLWQAKDLAQLLYSSELADVDHRDRLLFWRLYLGAARRTFAARLLGGYIRFKWRRYRRHNLRKTLAKNGRT